MDPFVAARRWIEADPDPETRAAGQALLDAGDPEVLRQRFVGRLQFGTAGLRGPIGPGPNAMNRATVRRATLGYGRYLLAKVPEAAARGVVVGFDGRHGSRVFADEAARILAGLGLRTWRYDEVVPTPQLAHAVKNLGAAGGVMVTASHNPPQDNGYKVYWENGAQIVSPIDAGISAAIDAVEGVPEVPDAAVEPVPDSVLEAYLSEVDAVRVYDGRTNLRVVYTAMHGVGRKLVELVLRRHGYTDLHVVPEQADPDPDFSTVAFPNPEEAGALDLALALAKKVEADIVIANDPDADRLAVAIPDGEGGFRALTGNQVGVLLADELLRHGANRQEPLVATTVVSSTMLRALAARHGVRYAETLTGFKWLANLSVEHAARGGEFVMGYEEALGYSVGPVVRDKDGVSAALVFCDLAARCKAAGSDVAERLAQLYEAYGLYASLQRSLVLPGEEGKARIRASMARLRGQPPAEVLGMAVTGGRDYLAPGSDLPPTDLLAFDLADGTRILARPSGTEPKLKLYFEVRADIEGDLEATQAACDARLEALADAFQALLE